MTEEIYAFDWDDEVSDEGAFVLLDPGIYQFSVSKIERERFEGSAKIPPCPRAKLTLSVVNGNSTQIVTDRLLLCSKVQWRVYRFFECLGFEKGDDGKIKPAWNQVEGKEGFLEIGIREYQSNGQTRQANEVVKYLSPAEAMKALDSVEVKEQSWSL